MKDLFNKNDVILFQGDSITDCGRGRIDVGNLGHGYVMLVSAWLSALYPQHNLKFINRGISGDKTNDLISRWDDDCVSLKPNWISLLIGINNTLNTSVECFEKEYRDLLERSLKDPDAKIILCSPFYVTDSPDVYSEDLSPKIEVVNKLASEYGTILIPLDKIFQESCLLQTPAYWAPDGVHPSLAGHALIAQSWLKYSVAYGI